MRGFLLAAGLGTRLRPITDLLPKPAVPVGFRPLAAAALDTFRRAGIRTVDINAHHLPDALELALGPELEGFDTVHFHREPVLLGTGGGLGAVLRGASEEVLVMNGDILFSPDVDRLLESHRASGALATLMVREDPDALRAGAVRIAPDGRILSIAGAPEPADSGDPYLFTGVHVLSPEVLAKLPESGCIVRQLYQPLIADGARLSAVVDDSDWADLGTVGRYLDANVHRASQGNLVHPSARLGVGTEVVRSVVHGDAVVAPGVRVVDSVILAGAVVSTDVRRSVVLPGGLRVSG